MDRTPQPTLRLVSVAAESEAKACVTQDDLRGLLGQVELADETAFESLYRATVDRVYGLACRILGPGPDAEEITEDVYLFVWNHASRYRSDRGEPITWLFTLARSRAIDRYRHRAKLKRLEDALEHEAAVDVGDESDQFAYQGTRLQTCVAALPPLQRQILALAYFRGMTHSEIAQHLEMSLGTVKTHVRRTLKVLRAAVEA